MVETECGWVSCGGMGMCYLAQMGGWISAFWTSSNTLCISTHYKHEYSILNSRWPKGGLSEF